MRRCDADPEPFYAVTRDDVERLRVSTRFIAEHIIVPTTDHIVSLPRPARDSLLARMGLPQFTWDAVCSSWISSPRLPVAGRFDLRVLPDSVQIYEFNAQTATGLIEPVVSGHQSWIVSKERLATAWREALSVVLAQRSSPSHSPVVFFVQDGSDHDPATAETLSLAAEVCREAGYHVRTLPIEEIGLGSDGRFYTRHELEPGVEHIDVCYLLYPYDWTWTDAFGRALYVDMDRGVEAASPGTTWLERPHTILWANKAFFAVAWQLFGDDPTRSPYLIPTWFAGEQPPTMPEWVEKPFFGRAGSDIRVIRDGRRSLANTGEYEGSPTVVSALAPPPTFDTPTGTTHAVVSVWLLGGEPAGLSIREDADIVTGRQARRVGHAIVTSI